ncbi:sugar ABC transporter permease [Aggregatilineales bacterium SYSU G02658]
MTTLQPKLKNTPDLTASIPKPLIAIILTVLAVGFAAGGFLTLRDARSADIPGQVLLTVAAIVWGIGAVVLLYYTANYWVEMLPEKLMQRIQPFIFVGPALAILGWYLAIPTLRTFWTSLTEFRGINCTFLGQQITTTDFVLFGNYLRVVCDRMNTAALGNNLTWMIVGTSLTVGLGLLIAILADRSKFERVAKSFIFMPMAISMVGAGVIWRFIYDVNPDIGLLNALVTSAGGQPQAWLTIPNLNNILLIIVMVWLQTGYAMVLISAAIKGVPDDLLEAARVDGANEIRIFTSIILPSIAGTLVTVITTVVIFTLKTFDIVMVMTGGQFNTEVIGVRFYREFFNIRDDGMGSAIAIVLLLAVIPVMIYNLRQFTKRETF